MGDETTQFASRYGAAVDLLKRFASDDGFAALRRRHGRNLGAPLRDALEAVAAVHETRTEAVKHWAEHRAAVLAQLEAVRGALERGGADAEARRQVSALVALLERADAPR